jgi:hypothetical protein
MRPTRAAALLLFAAVALPLAWPLSAAVAQDTLCGKPRSTPEALYELLAKDDKMREMRRGDIYVALEDGNDGTLWTFTLPAHPAHPAAICRRVMERRGVLEIPTSIQCNGSEAACAKLKSDFDMLNERMLKDLHDQQRRQQQPQK